MNTSNIGQEIAIVKDDPKNKNVKIYVTDEQEDNEAVKFFNTLDIKAGKFQVVPDKDKDRTSIFIVGRNGSGKSYWIKDYITEFIKRFPKYPIFLFSSKNEDENLDKITKIKRVPIDVSFIEDPINYEDLSSSLCIFDDIDGLRGKLKDEIYYLRDKILKNGRSYKIHIISTNHDATGKDVQAPLNESDMIVFFMKNYNRCLRYLLENYIGLEKEQISKLRRNKSRATTYMKTYPNVIIQERQINTFDGL
jgi:hypothetical protein